MGVNLTPPPLDYLADLVTLPPAFDVQSEGGSSDWETGSEYATTNPGCATDGDDEPAPLPPDLNRAAKRKASAKQRRQVKRQCTAKKQTPTSIRVPTFHEAPSALRAELHGESDFPANSTGFSALWKEALKADEVWTLGELREKEVILWDGK